MYSTVLTHCTRARTLHTHLLIVKSSFPAWGTLEPLNEALIRNSSFTFQLMKNVLVSILSRCPPFGTRIHLITIYVTIQYV
jgi:hypothetical protein